MSLDFYKWKRKLLMLWYFRIIIKFDIERRMLSKSKTNRSSLPKTKDVSMQHLATLSNFLEGQQSQTQYINKEIVVLNL